MGKEISNFDIVRENILQFGDEGEFYMVLVLRRRKDVKGKVVEGVNEDNRLIKHFFAYNEICEKDAESLVRHMNRSLIWKAQGNPNALDLGGIAQSRMHKIIRFPIDNSIKNVV